MGNRGQHRGRGLYTGHGVKLLDIALLTLLAESTSPKHGYALMGEVEERFGIELVHPQPLYRGLQTLEGRGLIVATGVVEETKGPPRVAYSVTELGRNVLSMWIDNLTNIIDAYQTTLKGGNDNETNVHEKR